MVTLTVSGEDTTIKIEYTAPTIKLNAIMDKAMQTIFEMYPYLRRDISAVEYSELKIADKKILLDNYIKWQLLEMSRMAITKTEKEIVETTIATQLEDYKL